MTGPRPPSEPLAENVWEAPKAPLGAPDGAPADGVAAPWWIALAYMVALIAATTATVTRPNEPVWVGTFMALVLAFSLMAGVVLLVASVRLARVLLSSVSAVFRGRSTGSPNGDE